MTLAKKPSSEWTDHALLVLANIKRIDQQCTRLNDKMTEVLVEISALKVKAGVWGAIGGMIPVGIGLAVWFLKGG